MQDISLEDKKPEILRAIEYAKTKGVTAIKVELEAQLGRSDNDEGPCDYCHRGRVSCDECIDGMNQCEHCEDGFVDDEITGVQIPCPEDNCDDGYVRCINACDEGYLVCDECEGNWQGENSGWGNARSLEFILNRVGIQDVEDTNRYHFDESKSDWLQFAKFYNDGSVDSELTFTVRLDKPENALHVLAVVDAFKALSDEVGNGMNTDGAGMHMAWLFTEDYVYPAYSDYGYNQERKMRNFKQAIGMMMPALYFLAAPANGQNWTRGIHYREPRVGFYPQKYSAIYFANGAMEFRVFDTCYDCPEQLLDNMVVMSNCLRYWSDTYNGPAKPRGYDFGNEANRSLDRLFYEENTLDMLYTHIGKLKPKYYTMTMLRKQRGFKMNKGTIKKRSITIKNNAELAWAEYIDRWNITRGIRIETIRYDLMRQFVEQSPVSKLRGMTQEQIRQAIEERLAERQKAIDSECPKKEGYVANHEQNQINELAPRWRVNLT